jgi:dihydrofolate reductase
MGKIVLYIAASIDGYIAKEDGSVDWLDDVKGDGGDNGYGAFYDGVDSLVMGRNTYEKVRELAGEFPYADKPCFVLSRMLTGEIEHVTFTNEPISEVLEREKGNVWIVGGGEVVKECLEQGLLDELYIAIIPKVLGRGIPLFPAGSEAAFALVDVEKIGDIVSIHYRRKE